MESAKIFYNGTLINFLLIVFQVGFLITAFGFILYLLFGIIAFSTDGSTFPMGFPVMFSLEHDGIFNPPDQLGAINFIMHQGTGIIEAENLPKGFVSLFAIIYMFAIASFLLSLKFTIAILEAVKEGGFLIIENAIRLRRKALLGIVMYLLDRLATFVSSYYLSDKLEFSGLEFISVNFYSFFNVGTIFYSLFLLVIAEAFRIGALLKQETDLTI